MIFFCKIISYPLPLDGSTIIIVFLIGWLLSYSKYLECLTCLLENVTRNFYLAVYLDDQKISPSFSYPKIIDYDSKIMK